MDRRRTNNFFSGAQIFGSAAMSFMHGAQDGQKFIGNLLLGTAFANGRSSVAGEPIPVWLMLLCSAVMGIGTSVGGERIIKAVGMKMTKLEIIPGFFIRHCGFTLHSAFNRDRNSGVNYAH
jgi:PiT family inorganic phosphate transporter